MLMNFMVFLYICLKSQRNWQDDMLHLNFLHLTAIQEKFFKFQ